MRRERGVHAWIALLVIAAGCGRSDAGEKSGPRLQARWTGADTAGFAAPATAERCDSLRLLEIRAVSGDTGVELALFRAGSAEPGSYPIRPPDQADSAGPSAALALRWFSRTAVRGFQSDSGKLTLRRAADGALSGSFTATAHSVTDKGKLAVTGSFEGLREGPAARGCAPTPAPRAAPPDSAPGVH